MWQQIIGAGIGALGSLFGDDDEQTTTTTVDYKAMAKAAEKAGFNPLTAIRNGGSAGFTTTHTPALSMADRFGSMFQQLGNAIMAFDPRADERAALEDALTRARLDALNRSNAMNAAGAMAFPSGVPSAAGATTVSAAGRPLANPPVVGPVHKYGEPQPLYRTVYWFDENGVRHEQDIVNIEVAPDEPTGLLTPAAVRFGSEYDESRKGPQASAAKTFWESWGGGTTPTLPPLGNPKPRGNPPGTPRKLPDLWKETKDWFKPWEGVFW